MGLYLCAPPSYRYSFCTMLPSAESSPAHDPYAALRVPDFRRLVSARTLLTVATRVQGLVVSWQIYHLTNNPLALGLIGLAEAIPSIVVSLYAGYVADSVPRKNIVSLSLLVLLLCAGALAALASPYGIHLLAKDSFYTLPLYTVIFVSGLARGFAHGHPHQSGRKRAGPAAGAAQPGPHLRAGFEHRAGTAVRVLLGHDFLLRGLLHQSVRPPRGPRHPPQKIGGALPTG